MYSNNTDTRIRVAAVYAEIALIIFIITMYSLWAFQWSDIGATMHLAFSHANGGMIAVYALGSVFWGAIYIGLMTYNVWLRCEVSDYPVQFVAIAATHPLYHVIRWPIFAAMVVNSVTILRSDHSSEEIVVNETLIAFAMWLEPMILGCVLALFAIVYPAYYFCRR